MTLRLHQLRYITGRVVCSACERSWAYGEHINPLCPVPKESNMETHGRQEQRERVTTSSVARDRDMHREVDVRAAFTNTLKEAAVARRWGADPSIESIVEMAMEKLHDMSDMLKPGPGEDLDDYK